MIRCFVYWVWGWSYEIVTTTTVGQRIGIGCSFDVCIWGSWFRIYSHTSRCIRFFLAWTGESHCVLLSTVVSFQRWSRARWIEWFFNKFNNLVVIARYFECEAVFSFLSPQFCLAILTEGQVYNNHHSIKIGLWFRIDLCDVSDYVLHVWMESRYWIMFLLFAPKCRELLLPEDAIYGTIAVVFDGMDIATDRRTYQRSGNAAV